MSTDRPRIVVGVTSPISLMLMRGLPDRLAEDGWAVSVVSSPGEELDRLADSGAIDVHPLSMARDPSVSADLRSLIAWVRLLRRLRPRVVLVGTPKAGMLGVVAAFLVRVPVRVYHLRGLRLETETGLRRVIFRGVESLTLAAATVTVAVSRSLARRVVELRLGREKDVTVLGLGSSNGVDVDRFRPASDEHDLDELRTRLGLADDVPTIGYVGRIHPDKGLDTLVDASRSLSARGVRHRILIVGGTDHPSAQDLVRRFHDLDAQTVLTGSVADVAPYYRLMTVHCLPTLREGFPNAVLEASASGIVTVTTDATGAVDSVVPGETGYIARAQDAGELADALAQALTDPEEARRRAQNARTWVAENFSRPRVQADLMEFLRSTAGTMGRLSR